MTKFLILTCRWVWQHSVSDADFTFWAPGSPGGDSIEADCAIMNSWEDYMWSDENCLHALASPICQRGEEVPITTTTVATTPEATTKTTSPYQCEYH